mmetsp:Transcript_34464/g.68165  ORF Transcript_34464/g.68165 Transcript_34464/m.68165 type:complete len:112 (-) Transcript_34464:288-623(-)
MGEDDMGGDGGGYDDEAYDVIHEDENAELKPSKERITSPFMTKYEKARIIGTRALQISMNAPVTVDVGDLTDPLAIAEKELHAGTLPFIIRRYLPNGAFEDWPLEDMEVPE